MTRGDRGGDDRGDDRGCEVAGGTEPSSGRRQALLTQGLLRVFGPSSLAHIQAILARAALVRRAASHVHHTASTYVPQAVMTRPAKGSLSVTYLRQIIFNIGL